MRQGKNNRGRGRSGGRRNGNGGVINRNTTLDSNGPDVRLRGNAYQLYEKYVSLGNDASAAGERISAEAYYQHADHYFRVNSAIIAASEERRQGNGREQHRNQEQAQEKTGEASASGENAGGEAASGDEATVAEKPASGGEAAAQDAKEADTSSGASASDAG